MGRPPPAVAYINVSWETAVAMVTVRNFSYISKQAGGKEVDGGEEKEEKEEKEEEKEEEEEEEGSIRNGGHLGC